MEVQGAQIVVLSAIAVIGVGALIWLSLKPNTPISESVESTPEPDPIQEKIAASSGPRPPWRQPEPEPAIGSDVRIRLFCDTQRRTAAHFGLHMPALMAAYFFWMAGLRFLAFFAAGVVEAGTIAIVRAVQKSMNDAFVYRNVPPRPYRLTRQNITINAQLVDVCGDAVLLRVTSDRSGTKGEFASYSKGDFSEEDLAYITSIAGWIEKRGVAAASA